MQKLAGNVPLQDMNNSIISSARRGMYSQPMQRRGVQRSEENMDLSAMIAEEQKLARK